MERLIQNLGSSTRFAFFILSTSVLTPLLSYFVVRDFHRLKSALFALVPSDLRESLHRYLHDVDVNLKSVLRGQVIVVSVVTLLYTTGFVLVGLPAAVAVGMVTGVARFVPYLDVLLGGVLCFFILASTGAEPTLIWSVMGVFLAVQTLDGLVLTPRIIGRYSGLHPVLVILAILVFGDWFEIWGVLFALPLAAIVRVTAVHLLETYHTSRFFRHSA